MSVCLNGIKLITFDATNTLLKFKIPPWEYYASIARNYGYSGSGEELKPCMLKSFKIMSDKYPNFGQNTIQYIGWWVELVKNTLRGQVVDKDLNKIARTLIADFGTDKCWTSVNGATRLLKNIQKRDITIGIISNFDPRLHEIIKHFNIRNYIDFVLTSYEAGYMKPERQIFEKAISLSSKRQLIRPCEAMHIGDNVLTDYHGPRDAGWHSLLIKEDYNLRSPMNLLARTDRAGVAKEDIFNNLDELNLAIVNEKIVIVKDFDYLMGLLLLSIYKAI